MTFEELNGMTVLQLRKLAKDHAVVLGSGIDKAGIIEKLLSTTDNPSAVSSDSSESDSFAVSPSVFLGRGPAVFPS